MTMNVNYGTTVKVPINDNVTLLVREVTLTEVGVNPTTIEAVELREFLKEGEVYGHGLFLPIERVAEIGTALHKMVGLA